MIWLLVVVVVVVGLLGLRRGKRSASDAHPPLLLLADPPTRDRRPGRLRGSGGRM